MKQLFRICVFILILGLPEVFPARILVLYPICSKSHKSFPTPILQELAERGHEVVMVSGYKTSIKHPGFKDVIIPTSVEELKDDKLFPDPFKAKAKEMFPFFWFDLMSKVSKVFMEAPQVQRLLNEEWDLVMVSVFISEFVYGAVHKIGKPFIIISPAAMFPWQERVMGVPSQLPYVPDEMLTVMESSLIGKAAAWTIFNGMSLFYYWYYLPMHRSFVAPYFDYDLPDFSEIGANASMVLTNTHHSLLGSKPTMPSVIEAAGAHCRPAQPLPKELNNFLDGSGKNGFIYFSLGSVVRATTMPEKYRRAFLDAFEKMPYRVLWKWETEHMDDLPSNVKLIKWAPQQDILAHPKLRLFLTHGGFLSIQEALYHAAPFIGFPMFGDQPTNIKYAENLGVGEGMDLLDVTADKLLALADKVINDPSYKNNILSISARFRDQSPPPLERSVSAVEYVLRHKGAYHLKPAIANLPWYQYYWLDVFAFIFTLVSAVLVVVGLLLYGLYRAVRRCFCGKKKQEAGKKKKKNQ